MPSLVHYFDGPQRRVGLIANDVDQRSRREKLLDIDENREVTHLSSHPFLLRRVGER